MRGATVLGLGLVLAACAGSAWAATPSVDQMIDALTPKDVSGKCPQGVAHCRGIRAAAPAEEDRQDAPGTASSRPARHAAGQAADGGLLALPIEFATGSAEITPPVAEQLGRLGQALASARLAGSRFRIEGHTDTVGDAELNQSLSEKRAASVASFLESRYGVSGDRLQPVGMGEKGLAVPTPDQTAEMRNRRVQIVNLGAG